VRITTLIAATLAAALALPAVASAQKPIPTPTPAPAPADGGQNGQTQVAIQVPLCKHQAPIDAQSKQDKQPKTEAPSKEKPGKYEPPSKEKPGKYEPPSKDKAGTVNECAATKPAPKVTVTQGSQQPVTNNLRTGFLPVTAPPAAPPRDSTPQGQSGTALTGSNGQSIADILAALAAQPQGNQSNGKDTDSTLADHRQAHDDANRILTEHERQYQSLIYGLTGGN
jgi:hypothetical protein